MQYSTKYLYLQISATHFVSKNTVLCVYYIRPSVSVAESPALLADSFWPLRHLHRFWHVGFVKSPLAFVRARRALRECQRQGAANTVGRTNIVWSCYSEVLARRRRHFSSVRRYLLDISRIKTDFVQCSSAPAGGGGCPPPPRKIALPGRGCDQGFS